MAKNIEQKFTIDLSSVVAASINATKGIRRSNQAHKEAEFQKAIANGLPYEQQVKMREEQLKEEKDSPFADNDYIASLEKSLGDTKKLLRFNNYRTKYANTLGELNAGRINEETYLNTLRSTLEGIDDPELRLEIQGDIATAEQKAKLYRDTILDNQVKKAKYDGTQTVLKDAMDKVTVARAQALIRGSEDEVTAYDATLSALNSQLTSVKVQDTITNFQVSSATRGTTAMSKLNLINEQLASADATTPIKIGDTTYASAQQYWMTQRDGFLNGNSQLFGDFFRELGNETKDSVDADTVKHGYPSQPVLDQALDVFNTLKQKPEIQPYVNKLDITQAVVMSGAIDTLAKRINDIGTNNLTFQEADTQLQNIATKYGVNTDAYRLQLDESLRQLVRSGLVTEAEAVAMAPNVELRLPKVDTTKPSTTSTTTPTPTAPTDVSKYTVKRGDTLSAIAMANGLQLAQLLEVNPEYKTNPNLVREGVQITLPKPSATTPTTPDMATTPTTTPAPTPVAPTPKPQPSATTPVPSATSSTPVATTPTPSATSTPQAPATPPTPAPQQTPAPTPAATTQTKEYTIVRGDTLSAIAARNNTTVDVLAKLNNIQDPNKIIAGAKLKLQ